MATIKARKQANGMTRYTAILRIRRGQAVLHQEAKTFTFRAAAVAWAKSREVELEKPGALAHAQQEEFSLAALIRWYVESFYELSGWQRTKQTSLEFLENHEFGKVNALGLTTAMLIDHVRRRRADACRELRLVGRSKKRDRRPTPDELVRLHDYFSRRDDRAEIPMNDIMDFAIESARRQSEICRLENADNCAKTHTGVVRDAKHPRHKEGNHRRFKYTPERVTTMHEPVYARHFRFQIENKLRISAQTRLRDTLRRLRPPATPAFRRRSRRVPLTERYYAPRLRHASDIPSIGSDKLAVVYERECMIGRVVERHLVAVRQLQCFRQPPGRRQRFLKPKLHQC